MRSREEIKQTLDEAREGIAKMEAEGTVTVDEGMAGLMTTYQVVTIEILLDVRDQLEHIKSDTRKASDDLETLRLRRT
jgi:acetaldehyde dehydrogenase (acetylating)